MNRIEILITGGRSSIIGTTLVNDTHLIKFRCTYPNDSGRTESTEFFEEYSIAKKWFDENKDELGDVHFYACLINNDNECLDEELLDSFWDETTGM